MALADPGQDHGRTDDPNHDDSIGDIVRRAFDLGGDNSDQKASEPRQPPDTRSGDGRNGQAGEDSEDGRQPARTGTSPTQDTTPKESPAQDTTTKEPPTSESPTPCPGRDTVCNPSPGGSSPNPPASSGGGGGAIEHLPRYAPPKVPHMQLPQELTPRQPGIPGGPGVLDAGAGAAAAAPVGPPAPIAMPVIVAPPVGLGGGAGGAGVGAARLGPSPGVKSIITEPPGGRVSVPANVGSNVAVPNSSYRLGYTEYLRTAGLPQVAALAVPGLFGILVLTSAGGLVGYRQAKAGHAVRVSNSARFMR